MGFDGLKDVADQWYKVLIVIGIVCIGFAVQTGSWPGGQVAAGLVALGVGELINHPLETRLTYHFKITGHPRCPRFWGLMWDAGGIILIGRGVWRWWSAGLL